MDLFSRFVVGWALGAVNDRNLVLAATLGGIEAASPSAKPARSHDQGSTYTSENYQRALDDNNIVCSMSRRGNCYDNAVMESIFGTFKAELGEDFESAAHGKILTFDYIEVFDKQQGMHSTSGNCSPAEYQRAARMGRGA